MSKESEVIAEDLESAELEAAADSVESLFGSLCEFMQIEPERSADTYISTSIGALEYSCVIARQCGVNYGTYMEAVNNVWGRVHAEGDEGSVREQNEKGLVSNSSAP